MVLAAQAVRSVDRSPRRHRSGQLHSVVELRSRRSATRGSSCAAVGQQPQTPVLNPRHPDTYVVQQRRHTVGHRVDVPARPVVLAGDLADQSAGREPAPDFPGRHAVARLSWRRPARHQPRARPAERDRQRRLRAAIAAHSLATARGRNCDDSVRDDCGVPVAPASASKRTASTTCRTSSRNREGLIAGAGMNVYVRGTNEPVGSVFNVVERGEELVDPDTKDVLGYQGIYVGQGPPRPHRRPQHGATARDRARSGGRQLADGGRRRQPAELHPAVAGSRGRRPHHLRACRAFRRSVSTPSS